MISCTNDPSHNIPWRESAEIENLEVIKTSKDKTCKVSEVSVRGVSDHSLRMSVAEGSRSQEFTEVMALDTIVTDVNRSESKSFCRRASRISKSRSDVLRAPGTDGTSA